MDAVEQMRIWLAIHCPAGIAQDIRESVVEQYAKFGPPENGKSGWCPTLQTFESVHGFPMTVERARFVWADQMIQASRQELVSQEPK